MALSRERLLYLLNAWSANKAVESGEQELFAWVNKSENHDLLLQHIQNLVEQDNSDEQVSTF